MTSPIYTAIIGKEGDWWIGWIQEMPGVNCQEATREELIATLETTLKEFIKEDPIVPSTLSSYEQVQIQL